MAAARASARVEARPRATILGSRRPRLLLPVSARRWR